MIAGERFRVHIVLGEDNTYPVSGLLTKDRALARAEANAVRLPRDEFLLVSASTGREYPLADLTSGAGR